MAYLILGTGDPMLSDLKTNSVRFCFKVIGLLSMAHNFKYLRVCLGINYPSLISSYFELPGKSNWIDNAAGLKINLIFFQPFTRIPDSIGFLKNLK